MDSDFNRIVSILVDNRILLESILHFATLLGASVSEQTKLERAINNSTVDYRNTIQHLLEGWMARQGQKKVDDLVTILKEMDIFDVAEKLEEIFPSCTILSSSSAVAISRGRKLLKVWNVAEPVPSFVGREEEILQLDNFLQNDKVRVLVISGMGGQGKTQLCRKWIQLLGEKSECSRVIWLAGESSQIFTSSILSFLKSEVAHVEESLLKTFQEILDKIPLILAEEKTVLWVIDNVDTEYEEITTFSRFLLLKTKNSKIVITSRRRTILSKSAVYLTLKTLSPEAAEELIRQNIDGDLKEEDIKELCQETGFHALALQLSICFIKSIQVSSSRGIRFGIMDFLSSFRENKKSILEDTEELSGYDKNVLHHVKMTMGDLKEKRLQLPQEVMKILSLFRFDRVEFSFLSDVISKTVYGYGKQGNEREDKLAVEKALDVLHSLSLIYCQLPIIQIHPLIQETTRILYPEWKVFASSILKHVDSENLAKSNLQHILRLWEIASKEDSLLREHESVVGKIYEGLCMTSQIQILIPIMDSHRKNVIRLFGNSMGKEVICVIRAEWYYGLALLDAGKVNEAFTHLDSLLINAKRHCDCRFMNIITLEIETAKAKALRQLGREAEAVNIYESLLPRYATACGVEHNQTMKIKENLALTLSHCNRVKEGLELYEYVLQWKIANIGNLHPETLTTRHNIAFCYWKLGDLQKVKSEFDELLKLRQKEMGNKHFVTLVTRQWVADILHQMGDYSKARTEYEELIEDSKEVLGPAHPNTLDRRQNYVMCLMDLEETDKAITELEDVIEILSRTLGEHSPEVETVRVHLDIAKKIRSQGSNAVALRWKCIIF